jgi:hypothetical protein
MMSDKQEKYNISNIIANDNIIISDKWSYIDGEMIFTSLKKEVSNV